LHLSEGRQADRTLAQPNRGSFGELDSRLAPSGLDQGAGNLSPVLPSRAAVAFFCRSGSGRELPHLHRLPPRWQPRKGRAALLRLQGGGESR
jgi:hypothetical protein